MGKVSDIIEDLERRKASVCCESTTGLFVLLGELKFEYKLSNSSKGHAVFIHPELTQLTDGSFTTISVNCGHKPKKEMKKPYVVNVIRMLKSYQSELETIMGEEDSQNV